MLKPRKIAKIIKKWMPENEFIILNGARQVGKTSLLKILMQELKNNNISENRIFYLNFEEIQVLEKINQNPENLLDYVINKNKKNYFFIDEIQYLDNPSNFLKHIYDKYSLIIKIIATGSSNLELKAKFQDSLVGRKVSFNILPLDYEEFLIFKNYNNLDYLDKNNIPLEIKLKYDKLLKEYLIYGGMPAIALQDDIAKKEKLLNEYVDTYINRDIRSIGRIENISKFNSILKILCSQIGNLLNINELSNTINIPRRKIEKYLDLLKHTFVLDIINPYKNNIRSQVSKMPKIFFFDLGIRNSILNNFLDLSSRQNDAGRLFENFVFLELKSSYQKNIYFYRTVNKSEIDFIIEKNNKLSLIEVKYKSLNKQIDTRVIANFINRSKISSKGNLVNLNLIGEFNDVILSDFKF